MKQLRLAALGLAIVAAFGFSNQATDAKIARVTGVAFTVADLEQSIEFYTRVLDFHLEQRSESDSDAIGRREGVFGARVATAILSLGSERIELRQFLSQPGEPYPVDSRGNDAWFQHIAIVVSDMQAAFERLRSAGVTFASSGPQRLPDWNEKAGGIEAFYFRDPDRHYLELIHFPAGKGNPKWQRPAERLFLGIDHTAIVVADTDASLGFWRDVLGLEIVGGSENFGVEQEHLNGVFNARLRITTLRAPEGVGVELLDYLSPSDGRSTPVDVAGNDVMNAWTLLETHEPAMIESATRARSVRWVSPGFVSEGPTFAPTLSLRDPDRHGVQIRAAEESRK